MKTITLIALVLFAGLITSGCTYNVGRDGEYAGYLSDTWIKGMVWENYRISIKPELESTEVYHVCLPIEKINVFEKAREFRNKKTRVVMTYHNVHGIGFSKCTGYVVDDIYELGVNE